eukprot:TRINITY_DN12014_c0_g1_i1.p1 TRINITY_DN12014_c0_g1~~TRINITY_DN12014_c0_g1_i1.p1  ORF type:complete len:401 (-),score=59.04 TRINITY_DN12014_c0_g1_i1:164-1366(-)
MSCRAEGLSADEKEREIIIRRVRSLLKLGACKDGGKKLPPKEKAVQQVQQWKEIFKQCDRNGSGTLSQTDIKRMARIQLKIAERLVSDSDLQLFFSAIDEDGGGSVDFQEFLAFVNVPESTLESHKRIFKQVKRTVRLSMWKQQLTLDEVIRRFHNSAEEGIVDMANGDGSLGPEEMRRFFRKVLNVSKHEAPDRNLSIAFQEMDEDGGGTLDSDEFLDFIREALEEDSSKRKPGDPYHPGVLGGMAGCLPARTPRCRPGTVAYTGQVSSAPFCLHGRDLMPSGRLAKSVTPSSVRPLRIRPSKSEPFLKPNGLPHILTSPMQLHLETTKSFALALPSLGRSSSMPSARPHTSAVSFGLDNEEEPIDDNYHGMKGAASLNRIEHFLYNAGIDVRGHFHKA